DAVRTPGRPGQGPVLQHGTHDDTGTGLHARPRGGDHERGTAAAGVPGRPLPHGLSEAGRRELPPPLDGVPDPNGPPVRQASGEGNEVATGREGVLMAGKGTTAKTIKLRISRYRPERSGEPFDQEFTIPFRDDMVVLDALNYIKDHVDPTLAYRWSCRMGICGSCGANVDGTPKLTCALYLKDLRKRPVVIEPLENFAILKDLVVDIEPFMEKLESVKPYIIRPDDRPLERGAYRQTPEELDLYRQQSLCI